MPGLAEVAVVLLALVVAGLAAVAYLTFRAWREAHWIGRSRVGDQVRGALSDFRQHEEARLYLADLLGWEPSRLPPLGGWAASADSLVILAEAILARRPEVVVEFGSGVSSLVIGRCLELNGTGRLVSHDHHPGYAAVTRARVARLGLPVEVRVTPLTAAAALGYPGQWYATEALPPRVDMIVVDGPPMALHPETRGGAGPAVFPRLAPGGMVFLDDAGRPGERRVVARWQAEFPDIAFDLLSTDHGTAIGTKSAHAGEAIAA